MPNWCSTDYEFIGPKKQLEKFVDKLHEWTLHNVRDNDFGNRWLGNILGNAGYDWEKTYCRGSIVYLPDKEDIVSSYSQDNIYNVALQTETAWRAMNEVWDKILEQFPGVSYVYFEQEPGCQVYNTNDVDYEFFPWDYWIDSYLDSKKDPGLYHKYEVLDGTDPGFELDEFLDTFRDIFNDNNLTADEIIQRVKDDFTNANVSYVEINEIDRREE